MQKPSGIGGQAVMEGIMMRSGDRYAVAVRKPDGDIVVKTEDYKPVIKIKNVEKIPLLRGVCSFIDSMVMGISTLMYSAQFFDEEETEVKSKGASTESKEVRADERQGKVIEDNSPSRIKEDKSYKAMMTGTIVVSVLISVGLFIILPYVIASLLKGIGAGDSVIALAEALIRIIIFLLYMFLISRMKDIQRVFMYHGSEHKCINCLEHGMELSVENVMKSSRQHKRCGTSFLLFVVIISVVFFLIVSAFGIKSYIIKLLLRIIFIPVIAGIAYEILRAAGKTDNRIVNLMSAPGMALQKLVTIEPTPDQVEVAIAAVEAVFDWKEFLERNFGEKDNDK